MSKIFKLIHCSLIHSAMKCVHVVLKLTIQANTVIKYSGIFTTKCSFFFYFIVAILCELMKMECILVC